MNKTNHCLHQMQWFDYCLKNMSSYATKYGVQSRENILTSSEVLSFPDAHISDLLFHKLYEHGSKLLWTEGKTRQEYTANDIKLMSTKITAGLLSLSLNEEDIIFCACPDSVTYASTILGIHFAGLVYSGSYCNVPKREILFQVQLLNPKVIFCGLRNLSDACAVADEVDSVIAVVCMDAVGEPLTTGGKRLLSVRDFLDAPDALSNGIKIPAVITKPPQQAVCCIMFSSGSTGMPKGVLVTHQNAVSQCYGHLMNSDWTDHIEAGTVGFAHTVGLTMIRLSVLTGTQIVIQDNFMLEVFLQTVQEYKCTSAWLSPSELSLITKSSLLHKYNITSLKEIKVGGSILPVPVVKNFYSKTNNRIKVTNVYGLTECGDLTHVPLNEYDMKTAGALLPGHQMKILDRETGSVLPANSIGEIYVKSQQLTPGYYERAEANAENFTADGWFKTGDMACIKDDGLVYVVGRFKEVIKGDGEQVAPAELESILLTHEAVAEAAVIGVPDEDHCEVPMAFVVLRDSTAMISKNLILDFVNRQVADYKKIRGGIEFVKSLPKISIGKIDRMALKRRSRSPANSITV